MGRRPLGERAMTAVERQRRRREKLRAQQPLKPDVGKLEAENERLRKQVERLKRKLARQDDERSL